MNKTMELMGQGRVVTTPDTAVIQLGVRIQGTDLAAIQAENAHTSQAVLQAIQRLGITEIKTVRYTVDKLFDYVNGEQIDRGYIVTNLLEIRTNSPDEVGIVIDTAVNNGANVVEFISFEVSRKDYYYQQALNLAIMDAITKSRSIAKSLSLSREPVPVRIVEHSTQPVMPMRFGVEAAGTPIVTGTLTVEASATVEFEY